MMNDIPATAGTAESVAHVSWKINNFLDPSLWCSGSSVAGPDVLMPTEPATVWNIFIDRDNSNNFFHYVFRAQPLHFPDMKKKFQVQCELSFQDAVGNSLWKCSNAVYLRKYSTDIIRVEFAFLSAIGRGTIYKLLVNKDLILKCCFRVVEWSTGFQVTADMSSEMHLNCLLDNLRTLYSSGTFSDFTIVVKDKVFSVHKCILSSRSPVFANMFKNDTSGSVGNKLFLEEIDIKTMETFIWYLYTGQLCQLSVEEYIMLYYASYKYAVEPLMKTCVYNLINHINLDNSCNVFALGYYYNDEALKSAAITYISKNASSVLISENWRKLTLHDSKVASQLLKEAGIS